ncbi:MAG TPA: sugar phosphate isomerase/epimerase [Nitrososphaerales archaeon]|nr:sugar phosphate isomerase/epimerase [Nitrososphaerales archaeon]
MKLSVTTFPWGKLDSPRKLSLVLSKIKKIGFEGVGLEYGILPQALKDRPELVKPLVEKSGLENGGTFSPGALTRIKWAKVSGTPLIWVSIYGDKKLAVPKLRRFVETATASGVTALLHNELRSAFQTSSDISKAMSSMRDLSFCLDTAHGVAAGLDIEATIEKYSDRIKLVHLKDLRAKLPMEEVRFKRDFVDVGRGIINFQSVLQKLKDVGYSGEVMLEIEALGDQTPDQSVEEGYHYIRKLL